MDFFRRTRGRRDTYHFCSPGNQSRNQSILRKTILKRESDVLLMKSIDIGTIVRDSEQKYTVESILGSGGLGTVYKAVGEDGRFYAVKAKGLQDKKN